MNIKCFMVEPREVVVGESGRRTCKDWIRPDTGEVKEWPHQFGPGAMWVAFWTEDRLRANPEGYSYANLGPDGHVLNVETPGGTWCIDSRARNCTMPDDKQHRCWVRHGEAPYITVDKNGLTCAAGAGSIMAGNYHGFLRNGELVSA